MKITKEKLKQLINEELGTMVKEGDLDEGAFDWFSKQSHPDWAAKQVADIEAGPRINRKKSSSPLSTKDLEAATALAKQGAGPAAPDKMQQGLDALLGNFRDGLLALLKQPQMAEATEPEAGE